MPEPLLSPSVRARFVQFSATVLIICLGLSLLGGSAWGGQAAPAWVPDELLVGLRAGVSRTQAESIYRLHGASLLQEIPQIKVHRIRVPAASLASVERSLSNLPTVKFVDRNRIVPLALVPNDTYYGSEWHLPQIGAPQAWDLTQGTSGVIIAILDTGVDPTHPDLAAKLVPGYNFYDNNTNTADVYGHGTAVAGSAAAISNNGTGVAGVAWQNLIMPIRVSDTNGYAYYSTIASGLTWAVDHGAKVMNISFSGVAGSSTIASAAQYVMSKGGLVVAAAGNCGCYDATPNNPYIISVSATDGSDTLASWSSYGSYVDVSAPGVSIMTTNNGGSYGSWSGTSFSSPITAGVIGLMMSIKPGLAPSTYESLLEKTAVDLGAAGYDQYYGWGRVNAYGAVSAAMAYSGGTDTTPPTVSITSPAGGSMLSGSVPVSVSATDNVGVTQVNLYVDGALYASDLTSPYSFSWDTTKVGDGTHSLQATASDAAGNVGSSATISVSVSNNVTDTIPPTVTINSVNLSRRKITVSVSATDDVAVTKVELYVDGALRATLTTAPYTFSLNTNRMSAGTHTLMAKAYDPAGNVGTSSTASVTVASK